MNYSQEYPPPRSPDSKERSVFWITLNQRTCPTTNILVCVGFTPRWRRSTYSWQPKRGCLTQSLTTSVGCVCPLYSGVSATVVWCSVTTQWCTVWCTPRRSWVSATVRSQRPARQELPVSPPPPLQKLTTLWPAASLCLFCVILRGFSHCSLSWRACFTIFPNLSSWQSWPAPGR